MKNMKQWLTLFIKLMEKHYPRHLWDLQTTYIYTLSAYENDLSPGEAVDILVDLVERALCVDIHDLPEELKRSIYAYG